MEKSYFNQTFMKFKGQNIIFNEVLSRRSHLPDIELGEMGADFQSISISLGCWLNIWIQKRDLNSDKRSCTRN